MVCHEYRVVSQGIPETDVFIMTHLDFPNTELYATQRMVKITEESLETEPFECAEK